MKYTYHYTHKHFKMMTRIYNVYMKKYKYEKVFKRDIIIKYINMANIYCQLTFT